MIWFTSHKTDVVGKLDPKTGIVTEYRIPLTPKAMPGTHAVRIDKHDVPWFSENWAHNLNRLDPQTGKITQVKIEDLVPVNAPGFGNFSMTDDGYIWDSRDFNVRKIDPETGKVVQRFPLQASFSYDNLISADGKYYGGGGLPAWGNTMERMDLKTGEWINANTGQHMATAKRGGFDPDNNPWFGGGDGAQDRATAFIALFAVIWLRAGTLRADAVGTVIADWTRESTWTRSCRQSSAPSRVPFRTAVVRTAQALPVYFRALQPTAGQL
jgi:streptogramin lyase